MNCLVCQSKLKSFFTKDFCGEIDLGKVHYDKCPRCGLVIARELLQMSQSVWENLNRVFHAQFLFSDSNKADPGWRERQSVQIRDIKDLHARGLIDASFFLDYACGDAYLISRLPFLFPIGYDKYVAPYDQGLNEILDDTFDLVVSTCFFEHIRKRSDIDIVNSFVSPEGALAVSTLVCEDVSRNPDWDYLVPAHSVVYTNKAMQILFDQWGYNCSVYHPDSRMWFWFKKPIALELLPSRFVYKQGFVDYWK